MAYQPGQGGTPQGQQAYPQPQMQQQSYPQQQQQQPYQQATPYMQPTMASPPMQGMPQAVYVQPQGMVYQQPMQGNTVVVVEQQQVYFGRGPVNCICPNCRQNVVSVVQYSPGAMSWLACLGCFVIGLWPCMCIPFCMPDCQDVTHTCPSCNCVLRRREAFDS